MRKLSVKQDRELTSVYDHEIKVDGKREYWISGHIFTKRVSL